MNEQIISLKYLTDEEREILNIIWSLPTKEHYDVWRAGISARKQKIALRVMAMVMLEIEASYLEEEVNKSELADANKLMKKIMKESK